MMPIETWRGIERCLIVVSSNIFAYLGYRLYVNGVENFPVKMDAEIPAFKFALSGAGPGVLFMAFGGIILWSALRNNLKKKTTSEKFRQPEESTTTMKSATSSAFVNDTPDRMLPTSKMGNWDPSTVTRTLPDKDRDDLPTDSKTSSIKTNLDKEESQNGNNRS